MAAAVMAAASSLCEEDAITEEEKYGLLQPCRKLSPLNPPLKLKEYFMMERDRGKYMLYWAAIQSAFQTMVESQVGSEERGDCIRCVVVGPGLGRLIRFCLDAARESSVKVVVHALEANLAAVDFLKKEYVTEEDIVTVHGPLALHPAFTESDLPDALSPLCHQFDLAVSELLGSFGDDEFLPELTAAIQSLFLKSKDSIMIPRAWTTYVAPIHSPKTREFLVEANKPMDACYVMGLPKDCIFLAHEQEMWSGMCSSVPPMKFSGHRQFDIKQTSLTYPISCIGQDKEADQTEIFVHGFVGYFTSELWPGVVVDTRHTSSFRNCFHWECHYFPLKEPLAVQNLRHQTTTIHFDLSRKTASLKRNQGKNMPSGRTKLRLWYEWHVEQEGQTQLHNLEGETDSVFLHWPVHVIKDQFVEAKAKKVKV